jgi:hypothetical protein
MDQSAVARNWDTFGYDLPQTSAYPIRRHAGYEFKRLDWVGMALLIIGISIFVIPMSWAGSLHPWPSWQTLLPMFLGVAVLVAFDFYEAKPANPVIPHRIFHSKTEV